MNLFVFRIASSAKEKSPDRPDHACNGARTGPSVALRGAQREHGGGGPGRRRERAKTGRCSGQKFSEKSSLTTHCEVAKREVAG